jgi:hypothetical protein
LMDSHKVQSSMQSKGAGISLAASKHPKLHDESSSIYAYHCKVQSRTSSRHICAATEQ